MTPLIRCRIISLMQPTVTQFKIGQNLLTADPRKNYLRISLDGVSSNSHIAETSNQILEICSLHQATKILFDVRGLTGNMSTLHRFTMASVFAAKYVLARCTGKIPHSRFAVIGNAPIVDKGKFEENVAINRGLPVKTFTELAQALEWLDVNQ